MKRWIVLLIFTTMAALVLGSNATIAEDKMATQVDDSAKVAREKSGADASLFPGWLIDLSAGYALSRGNSDTSDFLARAAVIKKFEETWQLIAKGEYAWGEVKDQDTGEYDKTADRGLLSAQANLFVIESGFLYGRSEISYDKIKKLDRRLDNGIGVGYELYRAEETYTSVEAGVAYIDSKYEDNQRDHGVHLRLAQSGSLVINERVTLIESVEYKPKFEDFDDYLINAEAALRVDLFSQIYFMLSVTDRYDNTPAAGTKRNDLSVISSLGVAI
jgi:putative salt-induced outer membrane protein YdiY